MVSLSLFTKAIHYKTLTEQIANLNTYQIFILTGSILAIVILLIFLWKAIKRLNKRHVKQYALKRTLEEYERETQVSTRKALKELLKNDTYLAKISRYGLNKAEWNWQTKELYERNNGVVIESSDEESIDD